jgi:hypothetical protein
MGVQCHPKTNVAVQKTAKSNTFSCNQMLLGVAKRRSPTEKKDERGSAEIIGEVEQLKCIVSTRDMNLVCKTDRILQEASLLVEAQELAK